MEDTNKSLAYKIQESTDEVSCREKIQSKNRAPTIGDTDKVSKISIISSCARTRSNALSSTSTTVNSNTERIKRIKII